MSQSKGKRMDEGILTDIQRCSVHDGPGLRTTIFFKGCPLRCAWCHNPECISQRPQELFYPERCIDCGQCAQGCFSGARVLCGRTYTVDEVMEEIRQERPYYGAEGGVTLSGGEPLMQPVFAGALLDACRAEKIHTAMETSLFAPWETARPLLEKCDFLMTDLKLYDVRMHEAFTGRSNERILENLRRLDTLNLPLVIRTPVIPEANGSMEEIGAIAAFAAERRNLLYYELLPYHPLGKAKAEALGEPQQIFTRPDKARMEALARAARHYLPGRVRIAGVREEGDE